MEKGLTSLRLDNENYNLGENRSIFRCSGCKGTFQKPILATVSSLGYVQKYYACPYCLTKVTEIKHSKSEESQKLPISKEKVKKMAVKDENNVECKYFLGYLKKRPRDTAFPDECLTCDKMIECLTH